jgi:hypothetical protein
LYPGLVQPSIILPLHLLKMASTVFQDPSSYRYRKYISHRHPRSPSSFTLPFFFKPFIFRFSLTFYFCFLLAQINCTEGAHCDIYLHIICLVYILLFLNPAPSFFLTAFSDSHYAVFMHVYNVTPVILSASASSPFPLQALI